MSPGIYLHVQMALKEFIEISDIAPPYRPPPPRQHQTYY